MALRAKDPFPDEASRTAASRFGMWLFLVTLAVIFASTLLAYVIVRLSPLHESDWPPPGMPPLPRILLLSTAVLVISSATMHAATAAARRSERSQGGWMLATLCLGVLFLVFQTIGWWQAVEANMRFSAHLYAWTFFVLTILHALHVLGGIPPMVITTVRALRCRYGPGHDAGIVRCAMYWHFLDVVWLVLYATLLWGSR